MATFENITADSFSEDAVQGGSRKRQRYREALSCRQCREKKVKCDRNQPCDQCKAHRMASRCTYTQTSAVASAQAEEPGRTFEAGRSSLPQSRVPSSTDLAVNRTHHLDGPISGSHLNSPECSPTASSTALTPQMSGSMETGQHQKAKVRLKGETHWRSACNELPTLKQMIEKSPAFVDSRHAFRDVKRRLRTINLRPPPPLSFHSLSSDFLMGLLPERPLCMHWISRYLGTYGKLFDFIHPKAILTTNEKMWHGPSRPSATSITLVLLTMAVAMQSDVNNRLLGRRIAQQLQDFFYSTGVLRKPSFEVFQNLCLLVLLKYISVSDSDKFDDVSSMLGKTQQMAFAMGLHRDPASFPTISTYEAGLRRRLWSNFFRLALEHSVHSGTPLIIRTEDVDSPPPPNAGWDDGGEDLAAPLSAESSSEMTESTFGIVMYEIAAVAASLLQDICSPGRKLTLESGRDVQKRFQQILTTMPACLQYGNQTTNASEKLLQVLIYVLVQRSSLLLYTHLLVNNSTPDAYLKTLLFDIWDSSCSILASIRAVSADAEQWTIGYQFLWADACRAVFCEAMVLRRIRPRDELFTLSSTCQHIALPLQNTYYQDLSYLSDLWRQKVPLGPNAAKIYLYLKVLSVISPAAMSPDQDTGSYYNLLAAGVRTANQSVEELKRIAMDQQHKQQQQHLWNYNSALAMAAPSTDELSWAVSARAVSPSPINFSHAAYPEGGTPNLATAGTLHRPEISANTFLFDGSGYDMTRQSPHHYSFGSASSTTINPSFNGHSDQFFPVTGQKISAGNMVELGADAISPLITASDGSVFMPWADGADRMNSFPTHYP